MPNSSDPVEAQGRLQQQLTNIFQDGSATIILPEAAPFPMILLKLKSELAGFALSNGEPKRCYQDSYQFFKKLYAERHQEWDAFDLSFVLCLGSQDAETEKFCSEIENDVYFCRKFVLLLDKPVTKELQRLPFIPLAHSITTFVRPLSAQTVLKNYGVPSALAEAIVVQHVRSAEGIAQDCLAGMHGDLELGRKQTKETLKEANIAERTVRLEAIEITNFRAYRKTKTLDLDADLVVLYGPNGFGKTSLFDAIDFGVTGEIGRLQIAPDRFRKAAKHLDSGTEASTVKLSLRAGDTHQKISRIVEESSKAMLDGESVNRRDALLAFTGSNISSGADRIDNMTKLFRATHLFSQEFPSLTESLRKSSELSSDVVSRLLAFEDFVNAGKKTIGVTEELKRRVRERLEKTKIIMETIRHDREELSQLRQRAKGIENPKAVGAMVTKLRGKLHRGDIDIGNATEGTIPNIRGWRALVESGIAETASAVDRLARLLVNFSHISSLRRQVADMEAMLIPKRTELAEMESNLLDQRNLLDRVESEIIGIRERVKALTIHAEKLGRHRQIKLQYGQFCEKEAELNGWARSLAVKIAELQTRGEQFSHKLQEVELRVGETENRLIETKHLADLAEQLLPRHFLWQQQVARRRELEETRVPKWELLSRLQIELQSATAALNERILAQKQAAVEVARHEQEQTALGSLLTEIERFITTSICPVCGDDHGSREQLLALIHAQRGTSAVTHESESRLQREQERMAAAGARVQELKVQIDGAKQVASSSETEAESLALEIADFEDRARHLGIDTSNSEITAKIKSKRTSLARVTDDLVRDLQPLRQAAEACRSDVATSLEAVAASQRELTANSQGLAQMTKAIAKLRMDALRIQIDLEVSLNQIEQDEQLTQEQIRDLRTQLASKEIQAEGQQTSVFAANQRVELVRDEIQNMEGSLAGPQETINQYEHNLRALSLAVDSNNEQLTACSQSHTQRLSVLEELKQNALSLEAALDAAATSVSMTGLLARIKTAEEDLKSLTTSNEQKWLQQFVAILEVLQEVQSSAVMRYTEQFGPRTSVIQQRLRPVSGFEEIDLKAVKSSIEVRVIRNGEPLRPMDYFSQSQQQILMLSLFLTASTTQSWSSFAPILLDDPVTHFDDLNTYAFLDLLGGLLDTGSDGRQFIISTCDERIFQLARHKFQRFGGRAKLYTFLSMSRDGPIIERA